MPGISLDPMEATFKATGFNSNFDAMASSPYTEIGLQIRANLCVARGQGKAEGKPVKMELKGWFSSAKVGSFKQGEGAACEYKMEVIAMKLEVDGRELKEVDIDNHIWKVDGVDLLADFRKNLGIA